MEKIKVRCITDSLKLIKQGEEYDLESSTSSTYYIKTSRGLIGYLKERFEVVPVRAKDHNDFQVGDIITYIPDSRRIEGYSDYTKTNEQGTYQIIQDSGDDIYIEVITHKDQYNISKRWMVKKRYFKYVEEQVVNGDNTSGEKPVERTEKEIMEGITYISINNRVYADVPHKTGALKYRVLLPQLTIGGSSISCGVNQAFNLNGLGLAQFKNMFNSITRYPQNYITSDIYEEMLKQVFKLCFDNYKIGFLMMSTNLTANTNHCNLLTKILGEFEFVTMSETHNRNSGHIIRLWVCDLYKNQVTDKSKK